MIIQEALNQAVSFGISRIEAKIVLAWLLKCDAAFLIAYPESPLSEEIALKLEAHAQDIASGVPIEHITGIKWFYGRPFFVNKNVLIPRPETEHIIEEVIAHIGAEEEVSILDVGTGSGCIAITLSLELPNAQCTAVDISEAALVVAHVNAEKFNSGQRVEFLKSDLLDEVTKRKFDVIVANLPYIGRVEEPELEVKVRDHEPVQALYGGHHGYELYERFLDECSGLFHQPRVIMCEVGAGQRKVITELIEKYYKAARIEWTSDLAGLDRVVKIYV